MPVAVRVPKRLRRIRAQYVMACDASGNKQVRPNDAEDHRFVVASIVTADEHVEKTERAWANLREELAPGTAELKARDFFADKYDFARGRANEQRHMLLQDIVSEILQASGAYVLAIDVQKQTFGDQIADADDGVASVSPHVLPGRKMTGKVNDAALFSHLATFYGQFLLRNRAIGQVICDAEGSEKDQEVIQDDWSEARSGCGLEGRSQEHWKRNVKPSSNRVAEKIEFQDSASSNLVQIADLIAGTICYANEARIPVGGQLLQELKHRSAAVGLGLVRMRW